MAFRELPINCAYETLSDDPVSDFYVPVLRDSIRYDRIAGFFSSSSLAIAARGIQGLIQNHGKMRIIASPQLSPEDSKVLASNGVIPDKAIADIITGITSFTDTAEKDHVAALGWMLQNGFLEVRLAFIVDASAVDTGALFHQKIGILEDINGDRICFSGSINETASGWLSISEEFKVFKSWEPGQDTYFASDEERFSDLWDGDRKKVLVLPAPQAIHDSIISIATDFDKERFIATEYVRHHKEKSIDDILFSYQRDAKEKWINSDYKLLFEMATGTGKTITAIACIAEFLKLAKKPVVIISTPQSTLSQQWKGEIASHHISVGREIVVDGTNHKWRSELPLLLKKLLAGIGKSIFIYTTHTTSADEDFVQIIQSFSKLDICFVGDEAHGLGATKSKHALLEQYKYRIGLSATPKRWFDNYGTNVLESYFGKSSFQFTIEDALSTINRITGKTFLVPYYYYPKFVSLTESEFLDYQKLTSKIKKLARYAQGSDEYQQKLESVLFQRARIEKQAANKIPLLRSILSEIGPDNVKNTIIFTSDAQIEAVMTLLSEMGIIAHRFTQDISSAPESRYSGLSERQYIIKMFRKGQYQALVAIKCLDEGIDIPSAETAIIMASSTNPREYVQRVGRVIRQAKDKDRAKIYDFTIEPNISRIADPDLAEFERQIFTKEFKRIQDMSQNSINNADVYIDLVQRMERVRNGGK